MKYSAMTMTDWVNLAQDENLSRMGICIYGFILAGNPFGDRQIPMTSQQIAKAFGNRDKKGISTNRIIKKLSSLGYISVLPTRRGEFLAMPRKLSFWSEAHIHLEPPDEECDRLFREKLKKQEALENEFRGIPLSGSTYESNGALSTCQTVEVTPQVNRAVDSVNRSVYSEIAKSQSEQGFQPKRVSAQVNRAVDLIDSSQVNRPVDSVNRSVDSVNRPVDSVNRSVDSVNRAVYSEIAKSQSEQGFQPKRVSVDYIDYIDKGECLDRSEKHEPGTASPEKPEVASLPASQQEILEKAGSLSKLTGQQQNLGQDENSAATAKKLTAPPPSDYRLPSEIAKAVLHPQKMTFERNTRPQVRRPKFLYPDGEWLDSQGRMNADFTRWMVSRWKVKFLDNAERPTEEIMADVLSYFANQPEKVAIQWDAYCAIAHRKVENITQRALTGFTMSSGDAREYAIAAAAIPTNQSDAATDFTPESVLERSAGVQRVLESAQIQIAPGQQKTLLIETSISDPWQEENWGGIAATKRQEWKNSRPPEGINFSGAVSEISAEPTPLTREGFAIVSKQVEPDSNQGAYKIGFEYQSPVQEIRTTPQDIADITPEQQAANCQKINEMIRSLTSKKSGKSTGKNWAEELSKKAKKAEKLLTKPQYQVNKDGYFIDEEGEW